MTQRSLRIERRKVPSLSQIAYEAIVEAVIDRDLKPNTSLSIDQLAAELEMSNTPVREALTRAAAERLVIKTRNRGFTVAPLLSEKAYHDLFHVRRLLELDAVRGARIQPDTVDAMTQLAETMATMKIGKDYSSYGPFNRADAAFHRALVSTADNEFLLQSWDNLHFHLHIGRLYTGVGLIDVQYAIDEHAAILDALRRGDTQALEAALNQHIQSVEGRLKVLVQQNTD